jgi:hypothetical protein
VGMLRVCRLHRMLGYYCCFCNAVVECRFTSSAVNSRAHSR